MPADPASEGVVQWIAASLASLAASLAGILAIVRRLTSRRASGGDPDRMHAVPRAAIMRDRQSDQLDRLAREIGGQRALLLKAHNGGEIPKASSTLKITIMAEAHAPSIQSVAGDYDARLLTDRGYLKLLAKIDDCDLLLVHTAKLPERSLLRDEYERQGLQSAWIAVVKREPRRFFYLSVSATRELEDDAQSRAAVRAAAARLSRLLSVDLSKTLDDVTG